MVHPKREASPGNAGKAPGRCRLTTARFARGRLLGKLLTERTTPISADDATDAQHAHTDLDPRFEALIGAIFERAQKARVLSSTTQHGAAMVEQLSAVLETHDPRYVSVIVDQIRRATETQLYPYYARGRAWFSGVDQRLIGSVFATDADAAYPLMTVWSGHVREAAVRSILTVPGSFCLALIVNRLNDWVAQVRGSAERKLSAVRDTLACAIVVGCIEYLWEFGRVGRASASARQLVQGLATRPDVLEALRNEALEGTTDRALRIVRRLLRTPTLDDDLLSLANKSRHPQIRATAMRVLLTQSHRWRDGREFHCRTQNRAIELQMVARSALADDAAVVQLAGLESVVANGQTWDDYESILMRYAAHSRNALAELAQWGLKEAGVDWVGRLREQLFDGSGMNRRIVSILGRFGNAEDGGRIWLAAAAMPDDLALPLLAASARHKVDPALERLRQIAHTSPRLELARRASAALLEAGVSLDADALKEMADRGDEFFGRGLGRHLTPLGAMTQLIVLARLERARANFDLPAWFSRAQRKVNRGAFTFSEAERAELQRLLADAPGVREKALRLLAIGV